MSHTSKIFEEAPVLVQNKNGFDLSHLNMGTSKCGQLVPVLCKLLPPNTDFTLGVNMEVSLPPLATTFYGRIDAIVEGFVIPCSILYGGFKQFISNQPITMFPYNQRTLSSGNSASSPEDEGYFNGSQDIDSFGGRKGGFAIPYIYFNAFVYDDDMSILDDSNSNDALFDYLGFRSDAVKDDEVTLAINMLPFLAYHLIHDVFYRNKQVTRTYFAVNPNINTSSFNAKNVSLVWHSFYTDSAVSGQTSSAAFEVSYTGSGTEESPYVLNPELVFPDGTPIWRTRQRIYARDYFTAGVPSPQQGVASAILFDTYDAGESGFTIGALRAANSLQKFLETNNLSQDYSDMMRNRWGARPIDADFDEPYYLGRVVVPVYQKSIYQQDSSKASGTPANPFAGQGAIGTKGASGSFSGEGSICSKFHNSTWAYVMCLFSLVPHANYGWGINRELLMRKIGDFPAPEFQTIGYEEVKKYELFFDASESIYSMSDGSTFAYIPRYSRFKYMDDEVHGELRPGRTLDSFVLQRDFSAAPELSTSFLEIGQADLDSVLAVSTEAMNLTCWYEIFFEFKVAMPLADFCIPTLGDLRDVHTIKAPVGGSRL